MKKIISIMLILIFTFNFQGCSTKKNDNDNKNSTISNEIENNSTVEDTTTKQVEEKNYYKAGEVIEISSDKGSYKFSVLSAKILPEEEYRERTLQIKYEYENIDFKGAIEINGELISDIVIIDERALKIKDAEQCILPPMSEGATGDWRYAEPAKAGEKCIVEHTFKIDESTNLEKIYVNFNRADQEYELVPQE